MHMRAHMHANFGRGLAQPRFCKGKTLSDEGTPLAFLTACSSAQTHMGSRVRARARGLARVHARGEAQVAHELGDGRRDLGPAALHVGEAELHAAHGAERVLGHFVKHVVPLEIADLALARRDPLVRVGGGERSTKGWRVPTVPAVRSSLIGMEKGQDVAEIREVEPIPPRRRPTRGSKRPLK